MKKLILLVVIVGIPSLIYFFGGIIFKKLDRTPPEITLKTTLKGLGNDTVNVDLLVNDSGAGAREIIVTAQQKELTAEVFRQSFSEAKAEATLTIPLNGRIEKFNEGPVTLTFKAGDASYFENEGTKSVETLIDFAKPQIQIVTLQHRAKEAGAEFVIFHAKDSNLKECGVMVGTSRFPALQAGNFERALKYEDDLYGALFAIPFSFTSSTGEKKIAVYANDTAGNESRVAMSFPIDKFKQSEASPKLSEEFINQKLDEMLPGYERRSGKKASINRSTKEGMANAFRLVNEEYREVLEKILLEKMTATPPTPVQWDEIFIKPMPSATSSTLGEKRHYFYDTADAGHSVHAGVDLASVEHDAVRAANNGTVVLSEEFGIYGNSILIDHGFGVFSLYGHLSSLGKSVGDKVTKNDEIGRTGRTGLAGGDHLHFEIRIRGIPVSPIEWWDSKWMQDDFFGKIQSTTASIDPRAQP